MQLLTDDVLVRGDTQLLTTVAFGVIAMNLFKSAIGLVLEFRLECWQLFAALEDKIRDKSAQQQSG